MAPLEPTRASPPITGSTPTPTKAPTPSTCPSTPPTSISTPSSPSKAPPHTPSKTAEPTAWTLPPIKESPPPRASRSTLRVSRCSFSATPTLGEGSQRARGPLGTNR